MVQLSDVVGSVASLFLLFPAAKDQFYRFKESDNQSRAEESLFQRARGKVAATWRHRRDSYSPLDSFLMFLGGIGLLAAFVLKIFGL